MINFDNAATTNEYGNPSSPHMLGINAERQLKAATDKLAVMMGCRADEIIFTSGGTESNNLALLGVAEALARKGGLILTTPYEHPSVLEPLRYLKGRGVFTVAEVPVREWPEWLSKGCVLASCSHVNNETGDINEINSIAEQIKNTDSNIIFHVDGAQGFCKEAMPGSKVDLYSFSSHKFHGPAGVGGLLIRRGTSVKPLMHGGGQQQALRPGTINVQGVLQTVAAAECTVNNHKQSYEYVQNIKDMLVEITNELPDVFINAGQARVSPYILNMSFMGIKGETLVHMLSERGIYASMGSACRTGKKDSSPLERMGYSKARAQSAVRFSFSYTNTVGDAQIAKDSILECVKRLRGVKRNGK